MLELYRWTLEGRPRCRGVRGVCIATCETCSLLPGRIHMLCLRWNIPTSSFVLCYKCIQFLVCSGISSWAKGYHAPWLDPRTGWLSLHVPSPPVFSSIRWHRTTFAGKWTGWTLVRKLLLDFRRLLAGVCPNREWVSLSTCLVLSTLAHTLLLISGGAIPASKYKFSTFVGLRHPVMARHA